MTAPSSPQPDPAPGDAGEHSADAPNQRHELVLVARGQRWSFAFAPGDEAALLRQLRELARDPAVDLNWFDAALLSRQIGLKLSARLRAASDHPDDLSENVSSQ